VAFLLVLSTGNTSAASTWTVNMTASNTYKPKVLTVAVGSQVRWHNKDLVHAHSASADGGAGKLAMFDFDIGQGLTSSYYNFNNSGTYPYHDAHHPTTHGKIKVRMAVTPTTGPASTFFTLTFGTATVNVGYTHDIQWRKKGGTWASLTSTRNPTTLFQKSQPGTYQFRSRLRYGSGLIARSIGWSPILTLVTT